MADGPRLFVRIAVFLFMGIQLSDHFNYKRLFRFVLPSMLMMVVTSVYGVIDGLFVSNFVGKTPFAAVNLIIPFSMILGGTGFMIGTGGTALVSKAMGESDSQRAKSYFTMLIIFAVVTGVILTVIGIAVMRPVAKLLGATGEMLEYCVLYGNILVAFTTFLCCKTYSRVFSRRRASQNLALR
ncbi:MAG: hypothetical protein LUI60_03120 [Clostridia bacterium]|nr:hypothetical protein [Clostridia bacterium]